MVSGGVASKGKLNQVDIRGDVGRIHNFNVTQNRRRVVIASLDDDWKGITFNVSEDHMGWLMGTYIGQTHNTVCPLDIQDSLHKAGIFYIKFVPISGNYVLLSPTREVDLSNP